MLHPTRRKNEGKNLGRKHLELSEKYFNHYFVDPVVQLVTSNPSDVGI